MAERRMWKILQCKRMLGMSFRRQIPLCGYIVDFYCSKANIAIEVDGPHHANQIEYDLTRDTVLHRNGIRVIRVPADMLYRTEYARAYVRDRICEVLGTQGLNPIANSLLGFAEGAFWALMFWVWVPIGLVALLFIYGFMRSLI
jgi:very-short-patch-repair endonuclease